MNYIKLPFSQTIAENIPLATSKLDKFLEAAQDVEAAYLDIHYPESQDIIFLLGGKAVKAGNFSAKGRKLLPLNTVVKQLQSSQAGVISFYEISKLLMLIIIGTFIFKPAHARLKTIDINFNNLLALFMRKSFTGYLEIKIDSGLNYFSFLKGEIKEGYLVNGSNITQEKDSEKKLLELVNTNEYDSEINVYDAMGNENMQSEQEEESRPTEKETDQSKKKILLNDFNDKIIDLCLSAIFEGLFKLMYDEATNQLKTLEVDHIFRKSLNQTMLKYPKFFQGVIIQENSEVLYGGNIDFDCLIKAKEKMPAAEREEQFAKVIMEWTLLLLVTLNQILPRPFFYDLINKLNYQLLISRKAYEGNEIVNGFLYDLARKFEEYLVGDN